MRNFLAKWDKKVYTMQNLYVSPSAPGGSVVKKGVI